MGKIHNLKGMFLLDVKLHHVEAKLLLPKLLPVKGTSSPTGEQNSQPIVSHGRHERHGRLLRAP